MIYVATYIEVQPEFTSKGVALLEEYRQSSIEIEKDGCVRLDALQETHRRNRFVTVEVWNSEASFAVHEGAGHTIRFREELRKIHKSPFDQRVHNAFAVGAAVESGPASLCVVTHVDVPPPRKDETEALLSAAVDGFRKQDGNTRFDILQQTARPNHFTVVAGWKNDSAFAAHESNAHTRLFREKLGPMLGALYDERLYQPM